MKIVYARSAGIYDDSRATKEILALLEDGHEVRVVGWDRDGSSYTECKKVFSEYKEKIKFSFYKGSTGTSLFDKILCRIKWSKWLLKVLNSIGDISVVHACDFDTGKSIRKFCKKRNIPYVYDIFDYYVDAHPIPRILRDSVEKEEIKVINCAAVTIICTEERKQQIKKSSPKKLIVVFNSPDIEDDVSSEIRYDYVYCGSMGRERLIGEIAEEYPNFSRLKFVYAGNGLHADKIRQVANQYPNFHYLGAIPYTEVIEVEKESRIISAIYNPVVINHRFCAPNKFYEAMALGKPLIVCKGTGIDEVVKDNNIGVVIDYDVNKFYDAVEYLVDNPTECEIMGENGRKLYKKLYSWRVSKQKLIDAYAEIEETLD